MSEHDINDILEYIDTQISHSEMMMSASQSPYCEQAIRTWRKSLEQWMYLKTLVLKDKEKNNE